ncbi:hypothetical protein F511_05302 [Dorcoceras hygrometricum]|uniref:Uncharacterized protein n=1 Tax=Dorcoceras hygrometricum TaxID=472368 RepID=A0A2Z7BR11_9LAMI|nr:hypothetical protein F511_05302 [Dorcoceras hygrometricum]
MVSMKNPLAAILDSKRFTGLNYQDWLRNLNLVLASEKLLYTIEKSPPEETPANISPEELITLNQWRDDEVKTRCYVMASMSCWGSVSAPGQAAEERKTENREAINTKNKSTFYDFHRMFSVLPRWHLCLAPTGVSRTRLFSVDCGSYANPVHDQIRDSFVRLH